MTTRNALAVAAAALLAAASVHAGENQATPSAAPPAAQSSKAPTRDAQASGGISFTRDVKQAWAQAREDGRRAGRAIGDGARSFGRATRDAAVKGWKSVKEAFSG
jgi:Spy/CpxP family protein refolding chaperone